MRVCDVSGCVCELMSVFARDQESDVLCRCIIITSQMQTKNVKNISAYFLFLTGSIVLFLLALFVQKAINTVFDHFSHMKRTTAGPRLKFTLVLIKGQSQPGQLGISHFWR